MDIIEFTRSIFPDCTLRDDQVRMLHMSVTTSKYAKYNGNSPHDLQRLELLGDKYIGYVFTKFCFSQEPYNRLANIDGGEWIVTRLVIKYLSTKWMVQMAKSIGLDRFIKRRPNENFSNDVIIEDVYEAWLGACSLIFDQSKLENFIYKQFYKLDIDISYESIFDSKTIFNDFVNNMNGSKSSYDTHQINSSDGAESYFKSFARVNTCPHISIGFGNTKQQAESLAASGWLDWYSREYPHEYWKIYKSIGSRIIWRRIYAEYNPEYSSPSTSPKVGSSCGRSYDGENGSVKKGCYQKRKRS